MKIPQPHRKRGFTLVECLAVVVTVAMLVALLIPLLANFQRRAGSTHCVNYLMQIGIATRVWQGDHAGNYPMDVPVSLGGAKELVATGNVAACFQVMSNELATSLILVCANDFRHHAVTNWDGQLNDSNISYFIGLTVTNDDSPSVLVGDDNVIQDKQTVSNRVLNLSQGGVTWTRERHGGAALGVGNVSLVDGSVRTARQMGLAAAAESCFVTNRVVIP